MNHIYHVICRYTVSRCVDTILYIVEVTWRLLASFYCSRAAHMAVVCNCLKWALCRARSAWRRRPFMQHLLMLRSLKPSWLWRNWLNSRRRLLKLPGGMIGRGCFTYQIQWCFVFFASVANDKTFDASTWLVTWYSDLLRVSFAWYKHTIKYHCKPRYNKMYIYICIPYQILGFCLTWLVYVLIIFRPRSCWVQSVRHYVQRYIPWWRPICARHTDSMAACKVWIFDSAGIMQGCRLDVFLDVQKIMWAYSWQEVMNAWWSPNHWWIITFHHRWFLKEKASPAFRITSMLGDRSRWPEALRTWAEHITKCHWTRILKLDLWR